MSRPVPRSFTPEPDSVPMPATLNDMERYYAPLDSGPITPYIIARHNLARRMPVSRQEYEVYTANSIDGFLDTLRKEYKAVEAQATVNGVTLSAEVKRSLHSVRFMLTTSGVLLIAREGAYPPHFKMNGAQNPIKSKCLCAGNFVFDEAFSEISVVNNKSGDFRPDPFQLRHLLAALYVLSKKNLLLLQEPLSVEHVQRRQTFSYTVGPEVLEAYVTSVFSEAALKELYNVNQDAQQRTVFHMPRRGKDRDRDRDRDRDGDGDGGQRFVPHLFSRRRFTLGPLPPSLLASRGSIDAFSRAADSPPQSPMGTQF